MSDQHPHVQHPVHLRKQRHREGMGPVGKANDWLATHLAVVFGLAWTIWIFMVVTISAPYFGVTIESKIFFYSSGCIQLFALPLMVYVGNKLQRSSDAQSDVQHAALTHIAVTGDDVKTLLDDMAVLLRSNTDLTGQVAALVQAGPRTPAPKRPAAAQEKKKGTP